MFCRLKLNTYFISINENWILVLNIILMSLTETKRSLYPWNNTQANHSFIHYLLYSEEPLWICFRRNTGRQIDRQTSSLVTCSRDEDILFFQLSTLHTQCKDLIVNLFSFYLVHHQKWHGFWYCSYWWKLVGGLSLTLLETGSTLVSSPVPNTGASSQSQKSVGSAELTGHSTVREYWSEKYEYA